MKKVHEVWAQLKKTNLENVLIKRKKKKKEKEKTGKPRAGKKKPGKPRDGKKTAQKPGRNLMGRFPKTGEKNTYMGRPILMRSAITEMRVSSA